MVSELATHTLRAGAPAPSVETLLHAILPHAYVDHTHADAVLSISNSPGGAERIREIYGDAAVVIPYIMGRLRPCIVLRARGIRARRRTERSAWCSSRTACSRSAPMLRESYERMIRLVSMAEDYLAAKRAGSVSLPAPQSGSYKREEIARLRRDIADAAGFPVVMRINASPKFVAFARHADVAKLSQQAPRNPRSCDSHQAGADDRSRRGCVR
jgi:rhamnose utilization protein RhaD (predicted bifunctional aldolase and dehydrogenase)